MRKSNKNTSAINLIVVISVLLLSIVTVGSSMIITSQTGVRYNSYLQTMKAGYIADENVYVFTSVDVVDEKATEEKIQSARNSVIPVFTFSLTDSDTILSNFDFFKNHVDTSENRMMAIAYEILHHIIDLGYFSEAELSEIQKQGYTTVDIIDSSSNYSQGTIKNVDTLLSSANIDEYVLSLISNYSDYLSSSASATILSIVKYCLVENIHYDNVMTTYYRDFAASKVLPVVASYYKGELIIPVDTVIKEEQINTLRILADNASLSFRDFYGDMLLMIVGLLASVLAFFKIAKSMSKHSISLLNICTISICVVFIVSTLLILNYSSSFSGPVIILYPVCFAPMLVTSLSGKKRLGVITSIMVGLGVVISPGASIYSFFYCMAIGSACAYMVRFMNKRLDAIYQFSLSVLSTIGITAFFLLLRANAIENMLTIIIFSAIRAAISNLIVFSIIPVLERLLNLPTVFRLHELAYTDSPLLIHLSQAAPGTYSHSRQVAELAAAAASEVGANAGLARVGSLYHDIGKMDYPEYFVENQAGGSKHEELNPTLSASIIRNHVRSGAEKGREAGLPAEIIDIIANHHGNDVIRYFYHEAVIEKEIDRQVEEQDFRYNAEPPSSKECAIVMLADSVEAAARTITEPTPAKFAKLIRQIIHSKIEHDQLNRCDLSMKDLEKISKSFLKTLLALYHSRIEYPDEDEN